MEARKKVGTTGRLREVEGQRAKELGLQVKYDWELRAERGERSDGVSRE